MRDGSVKSAASVLWRIARSRSFLLYAAFGAAGAAVDLGMFALLYRGWAVDKNLATSVSSFSATTLTFVLNARINFREWNRLLTRYVLYLAVAATGLTATLLTFYVFVDLLHNPVMLIKVGSLGLVFVIQFTLNRLITFRRLPFAVEATAAPATSAS